MLIVILINVTNSSITANDLLLQFLYCKHYYNRILFQGRAHFNYNYKRAKVQNKVVSFYVSTFKSASE